MPSAQNNQTFSLGYLSHVYADAKSAYFGGVLLTNQKGIPLEFRHTEAVKPSGLQKALYAEVLEPYLGSEVMGPTLVTHLQIKPNLLLLDSASRALFENIGQMIDVPVAYIQGQDVKTTEQIKILGARTSVLQMGITIGGSFVTPHEFTVKGGATGYVYALDDNYAPLTAALVENASKTMNVLAPFERVRNALYAISNAAK